MADGLHCTVAQLAIARRAKNPHVSSVIIGASHVEPVRENMGAFDVLHRLSPEVIERIDSITA